MKLCQFHRLGEKVRGAALQRLGFYGLGGMAGDHKDREIGLKSFCKAKNLRAVPAGKIQVENYDIRTEAIELQLGIDRVGSLRDGVSLRCEETTDAGADDRVGIDDQDSVQALTIPSGHEESREGL
jgi:hypothetical protein